MLTIVRPFGNCDSVNTGWGIDVGNIMVMALENKPFGIGQASKECSERPDDSGMRCELMIVYYLERH